MHYKSWFNQHASKHKNLVNKLVKKGLSKEEIIEYFDFENMSKYENDFCLLYKQKQKCHDIEKLNCYLCACPNFRFKDDGVENIDSKTKYSYCNIDSPKGKLATYADAIHQDCSACDVPHLQKYVRDNFDLDWKKVMRECDLSN